MTRSALEFSLAGWDETEQFVQYWSSPLAASRVLVLPANPPLLSGPGADTGNLDGI
jgi:hypothetical protein